MACGPGLHEVVEDQHYQPRLQLQLQPPSEPLCSSLGSPIPACRVKYFCGGSVKYITRLRSKVISLSLFLFSIVPWVLL